VGDVARANHAAGAAAIFDDHRLAERCGELLPDQPTDEIAAAAGKGTMSVT
jgi:hypothetical protein